MRVKNESERFNHHEVGRQKYTNAHLTYRNVNDLHNLWPHYVVVFPELGQMWFEYKYLGFPFYQKIIFDVLIHNLTRNCLQCENF